MNYVKLVLLGIIVLFAYILFIEQLEDVLDSLVQLPPGTLHLAQKEDEKKDA
jgi:hypothetical protein